MTNNYLAQLGKIFQKEFKIMQLQTIQDKKMDVIEIEKLLAESTSGPWKNFHNSVEAPDRTIANISEFAKSPEDGNLIAAAPQAIRYLLDLVKRMEGVRDVLINARDSIRYSDKLVAAAPKNVTYTKSQYYFTEEMLDHMIKALDGMGE